MWFANPRIYTRLVAIWLALSIASVVLALQAWRSLSLELIQAHHAESLSTAIGSVRATLDQAESSVRGYILSGDESALAPLAQSEQEFPTRFASMVDLVADQPAARDQLFNVRSDADRALDELLRAAATRRKSGLNSAVNFLKTSATDLRLGRVRAALDRINPSPSDLFRVDAARSAFAMERAFVTTLLAGFLGLGAGALALYFSRLAVMKEQNERALAEQAQRAERMAQEKGKFLANMSHEIRTPMNAILGFSELLAGELPADTRAGRYSQSIRASSQSLLQLINDVLDLSKVEAGVIELVLEPASVPELIEFLRTVFAQQATRKRLSLDFEAGPEIPAALLLDRSRLRQVLVNLIGNAIKFTERGSIQVSAHWTPETGSHSRGTLLIAVRDTGAGIPAQKQAEIFQPFSQVDPLRAAEKEGTGLGLSIVKRLVERMAGEIELESVPGEGSTFRVRLPGVPISARLPSAARLDPDERVDFNQLAPATVLVVDDNATNRDLLAGMFERSHHQLRFASNGREAVEAVRSSRPDLILMDIRMPEMDGSAALQEIHRLPGAEILPVIALTASSLINDEHIIRGLFAGYVRKPFSRQVLFREMAEFLPRHREPADKPAAPAAPGLATDTDTPARWRELVQTLRELERAVWPGVREGGAINEIKEFARRLDDLAASAGCSPLRAFARALADDAANYSVMKLEARLQGFPALIESIEQRAGANA